MTLSFYDSDSETEELSSSTEEYDSEDDYVAGGKRKRKVNTPGWANGGGVAKALPKPTYTAQVTESANDRLNAPEISSVERADRKIVDKIRKAMDLANHHGTGEAEAKAAMRMAMKLMAAENITQADLIASETAEERSTRAGHSIVTLRSTKGKGVRRQHWHALAADAACEAFDIQYYTESYKAYLNYIFYGLADNTVAAALSFEMLHNQIETWALERKVELKGQVAGNSYRLGVAFRVLKDSEEENRKALKKAEEDEKRRVKEEEEARVAEIAWLNMPVIQKPKAKVEEEGEERITEGAPKVEAVSDEDAWHPLLDQADDPDDDHGHPFPEPNFQVNIDDKMEMDADFDHMDEGANDFDLDALEEKVKSRVSQAEPPLATPISDPPRSPTADPVVKIEPKEELDAMNGDLSGASNWTSALQLRTFRDNAKIIAEGYIKDTGLKLRKGPKLKSIQHDKKAYNKGWNDGRKVDLKRRRIEDEAMKEIKVES